MYGVPTKNVCFCQAWHATTQVMTSGQLNSSITSPKGFSPIFFPKLRWFTWNAEVFVWRLFEVMIELTLTKWYFRQGCLWRMSWGKSESIRSLRPSFDWVKVHDYCTICNPTFWEYTIKLHDIFSQPKIFTVNLGVYIYIPVPWILYRIHYHAYPRSIVVMGPGPYSSLFGKEDTWGTGEIPWSAVKKQILLQKAW